MKRFLSLCALAGALLSSPALADHTSEPHPSATAGPIRIENPWARATPPGAEVGGVYLTLKNTGPVDRLVSGSSPVAERTELHTMSMDGGVMKMRPLPAIEVPAKGVVVLKPGGLHVMLVGLKRPLKEGERISLTLTFEKAGNLHVEVPVASLEAMGHEDMQHKRH